MSKAFIAGDAGWSPFHSSANYVGMVYQVLWAPDMCQWRVIAGVHCIFVPVYRCVGTGKKVEVPFILLLTTWA